MISSPASPSGSLQDEVVEVIGELAASLSINRTLGQIYGLLFIHSEPLTLDDIAKALKISKGNASINVRTLEAWGAVTRVWVKGNRRDYYIPNRNIRKIILQRLQEGLARRLELVRNRFEATEAKLNQRQEQDSADIRQIRSYLKELMELVRKAQRWQKLIPHLS